MRNAESVDGLELRKEERLRVVRTVCDSELRKLGRPDAEGHEFNDEDGEDGEEGESKGIGLDEEIDISDRYYGG